MKKETYQINIIDPCGENWNQMTPTKEGKFCKSCSRNLIDFSVMSDNEILSYIAKDSKKICGRFSNDQLNRPLQQNVIKRSYGYVYKLLASFIFFGISHKSKSNDSTVVVQDTIANHLHDSDTTIQSTPIRSMLRGKVFDKKTGKILDYATIRLNKDNVFNDGTYSNVAGEFTFSFIYDDSSIFELNITYLGYDTLNIVITPQMLLEDVKIELNETINYKGPVLHFIGLPSVNRIEKKPWWKRMWKRKSRSE